MSGKFHEAKFSGVKFPGQSYWGKITGVKCHGVNFLLSKTS